MHGSSSTNAEKCNNTTRPSTAWHANGLAATRGSPEANRAADSTRIGNCLPRARVRSPIPSPFTTNKRPLTYHAVDDRAIFDLAGHCLRFAPLTFHAQRQMHQLHSFRLFNELFSQRPQRHVLRLDVKGHSISTPLEAPHNRFRSEMWAAFDVPLPT